MALIDVYDHFFREPGRLTGSDADECQLRFDLLRSRIEARLVGGLGWDEHSLAVPVMAAYLERAIGLYVLGYFESCIVELHARVESLLRTLAVSRADLEALLRSPAAAPLSTVDPALMRALGQLAGKRRDLAVRDDEFAHSILIDSPARGLASRGRGAVIAESPTSQRLRWGSDLPDILALSIWAICLLIEASRTDKDTKTFEA